MREAHEFPFRERFGHRERHSHDAVAVGNQLREVERRFVQVFSRRDLADVRALRIRTGGFWDFVRERNKICAFQNVDLSAGFGSRPGGCRSCPVNGKSLSERHRLCEDCTPHIHSVQASFTRPAVSPEIRH